MDDKEYLLRRKEIERRLNKEMGLKGRNMIDEEENENVDMEQEEEEMPESEEDNLVKSKNLKAFEKGIKKAVTSTPQEEAPKTQVQIVEREINLTLINEKLNYIISLISQN